jgi:hypothetical protein
VHAVGGADRREGPPQERVDGPGEDQVQEHGRRKAGEHLVGGHGVAEHEAEDERREGVQDRHDPDREVGRVEAVAGRGLAVAADPEAGHGQEQRGEAQRPQVGRVDEQAGPEARRRAQHRAAQERDLEQHDEQQVGGAAEGRVGPEDRDLDEHGDEEQQGGLDGVHQRPPALCGLAAFGFGTSTSTDCSDERSTNGCTWICLKMSVSFWPTLVTTPIGMFAG